MDYAILKAELLGDPAGLGYGVYLANASGKVAELMNESKFLMPKSRMITARAIMAECANGDSILEKLEALSTVNTKVKWIVKFLGQDAGVDIGNAVTRSNIDTIVSAGGLTSEEGTQLKNMAVQSASRAEVLGFGRVDSTDIQKAMES